MSECKMYNVVHGNSHADNTEIEKRSWNIFKIVAEVKAE